MARNILLAVWAVLAIAPAMAERGADWHCGGLYRAFAGDRFEPRDGMNPERYPPDTAIDYKHLELRLRFEDLTSRMFFGTAIWTLRPVREDVRWIALDAVELNVLSVYRANPESKGFSRDATEMEFHYDGSRIIIPLEAALPSDRDTQIAILYGGRDPRAGLIFTGPELGFKVNQVSVHSENESEFARFWIPCPDAPIERFTLDTIIEAPPQYTIISNGKRIETTTTDDGLQSAHFQLEQTIVSYLISVAIGEFDVVEYQWQGIPVDAYVAKGRHDDGVLTFQHTPDMIELFSQRTGVPYAYPKYDQVEAYGFAWGGLEHTSATTLSEYALLDQRAALDNTEDDLIAHELAHQWFGDLVTCTNWDHIWLNEGFATFMETIWVEHDKGHEAYLLACRNHMRSAMRSDDSDRGPSLINTRYADPDDVFGYKGGQVYDKGACVLHMLRHQLGDDVFWKTIETYLTRFRDRDADTDDFRKVVEDVSGRSFVHFFEQWTRRPGFPKLKVRTVWDSDAEMLRIDIKQTQDVTDDRPAFAFPLDIAFALSEDVVYETFDLDRIEHRFYMPLPEEPAFVCLDPYAAVMAEVEFGRSRRELLKQLEGGPTVVARMEAVKELADYKGARVVTALSEVLFDESAVEELRREAAHALGESDREGSVNRLVQAVTGAEPIENARVREAVVDTLGDYLDQPIVLDAIQRAARHDSSVNVVATATESLGETNDEDSLAIILGNVDIPSYRDRICIAALNALAARSDPRGLDAAFRYAEAGNRDRLRPHAIDTIGRLGVLESIRDRARHRLIELLYDPQAASVRAAIHALARIDDAESRRALVAFQSSAHEPSIQSSLKSALARMDGNTRASDRARRIRDETKALVERLDKLEEKVHDAEARRHSTTSADRARQSP